MYAFRSLIAAALRTVFYFFPHGFPFLAPDKRSAAGKARFGRKFGFLAHLCHDSVAYSGRYVMGNVIANVFANKSSDIFQ